MNQEMNQEVYPYREGLPSCRSDDLMGSSMNNPLIQVLLHLDPLRRHILLHILPLFQLQRHDVVLPAAGIRIRQSVKGTPSAAAGVETRAPERGRQALIVLDRAALAVDGAVAAQGVQGKRGAYEGFRR